MEPSRSEVGGDPAPPSVTFRLTADEAYRVSRMLIPRWTPVVIWTGGILILICGAVLIAGGQEGLGIGLVVPAIFLLASRPIARALSMRRIARTLAKIPEPLELTLGPDGISGTRGQSSSLVAWADIAAVDVRGPFVWVRGHVRPVYAIPLACVQRRRGRAGLRGCGERSSGRVVPGLIALRDQDRPRRWSNQSERSTRMTSPMA